MLEYLEKKVRDETSLVTGTGGNIHEDRQWFVFVVPAVCYTMNNRWMWLCSARFFSSSFCCCFVHLFIHFYSFFFLDKHTKNNIFIVVVWFHFNLCWFFLSLQYHDLFITLITHRIKLHFFSVLHFLYCCCSSLCCHCSHFPPFLVISMQKKALEEKR